MEKQTSDMIETVKELKQSIKTMIDDLFTLDIEKVLNNTNFQMNITLDSINDYKNHFKSFKIPEELSNFLESYGDEVIQRAYDGIETLVNKETKNITFEHLENNINIFKNYLKPDLFLQTTNKTYSLFNENVDIIKDKINLYGIIDYPNNLNEEINRIESRNLRRLEGRHTEEDTLEEYKEKVADKAIDENFHKLLNISETCLNFIETYENFDKFYEIINKYNKKLQISYKESYQIIDNAYKDDANYNDLVVKLDNLNNYSLEYYEKLKFNFDFLKEYIKKSLREIDDSFNQCANVTYETFAHKYEEISNGVESIDKIYDKEIEDKSIKKITTSQNTEFTTEAKITTAQKKARFKFALTTKLEGKIKKPEIVAIVYNQINPKNVNLKIINKIGNCGKDYQEININFNNITYSTNLKFDTKSTLINVTTISDFESYTYTFGKYKIENSDDNVCICILNICNCLEDSCPEEDPIPKEPEKLEIIKSVYTEDFVSIEG